MKAVHPQSAHDASCAGSCSRLRWDEDSYRAGHGARAVDLQSTNAIHGVLRYCRPSMKTLAISHVWIHGQGGRPEDGMNSCLHQRYHSVAYELGCDSYWMDTPCIPSDHKLRMEAIRGINSVFSGSFATLVRDRDLMEIDIDNLDFESDVLDERAIKRGEEIVATVLVCDWNVRAWTFLESIKGRRNIRLLCKNNRTVSFQRLLIGVHKYGDVSIGTLALHSPHLLLTAPTNRQSRSWSRNKADDSNIKADDAGILLSHRPASRPGDGLVIWSLLIKDVDEVYDKALEFWRSRHGTLLSTGFLMSSAPRLKKKGLSWAPQSPQALSHDESGAYTNDGFFRAFDGFDTALAQITSKGLEANWLTFPFPCMPFHGSMDEMPTEMFYKLPGSIFKNFSIGKTRSSWLAQYPEDCVMELEKIRHRFLHLFRFGMLLQPIASEISFNDVSFALETPCSNFSQKNGYTNEDAARYRGQVNGTLIVVCGTNRTFGQTRSYQDISGTVSSTIDSVGVQWTWRGMYQWPKYVPLPPFLCDHVTIA